MSSWRNWSHTPNVTKSWRWEIVFRFRCLNKKIILPVRYTSPYKHSVSKVISVVKSLWLTPLVFLLQDCYLVSILNDLAGNSFMIFCSTCNNAQRVALLLRNLGITAIPLHGQMSQVDVRAHLHLPFTLLDVFSFLCFAFKKFSCKHQILSMQHFCLRINAWEH